jgi:hypothetical protein
MTNVFGILFSFSVNSISFVENIKKNAKLSNPKTI